MILERVKLYVPTQNVKPRNLNYCYKQLQAGGERVQ